MKLRDGKFHLGLSGISFRDRALGKHSVCRFFALQSGGSERAAPAFGTGAEEKTRSGG